MRWNWSSAIQRRIEMASHHRFFSFFLPTYFAPFPILHLIPLFPLPPLSPSPPLPYPAPHEPHCPAKEIRRSSDRIAPSRSAYLKNPKTGITLSPSFSLICSLLIGMRYPIHTLTCCVGISRQRQSDHGREAGAPIRQSFCRAVGILIPFPHLL